MRLSYQTSGHVSESPLVFIHGLGSTSEQATKSLAQLEGHYVIAPDMPGHGDSKDFAIEDLNFDKFADLVVELMDELGIESTNIGGISMGSGISVNLALRYPEKVKKLIIVRPSWLSEVKPDHLKLVAYVGQWIEELGKEEAKKKLYNHPDFQNLNSINKPVAESIEALFRRPSTPVSTTVLYKMWQDAPFSSVEDLFIISNPSLVLTTSRDELHPKSTAAVISAHLPNVQTADLAPRYHEPAAYSLALNKIVGEFLAG